MAVNDISSSMFLPMLEEEAEQLPEVEFDDSVMEIARAVNGIGAAVEFRLDPRSFKRGPEKNKDITQKVTQIYQQMKKDPQYRDYFSTITKLSHQLGENIETTFRSLRTKVKPDVQMLKEAIAGKMEEIVENAGVKTSIPSAADDKNDGFDVVQWRQYFDRLGGEEEVINEVKEITGHDYEPGTTTSDLADAVSNTDLDTENVKLDPETEEDVKTRIDVKVETPEEKEDLEIAMQLVFDRYRFNEMVAKIFLKAIHSDDLMPVARQCMYVINRLHPLFKIIRNTPLNVSAPVLNQIHNNLHKCHNLAVLCAQTLRCIRHHYRDALVMDESTVNGDNLGNAEDAGVSANDTEAFLRVRFKNKNRPIPSCGIRLEEIQEAMPDIPAEDTSIQEEITEQTEMIHRQALLKAGRIVLEDYLQTATSEDLDEDEGAAEFYAKKRYLVDTALNSLGTSKDNNLEAILYNFVIQSKHEKTALASAHAMFGEEVVKHMEADPDLSEETMKMIDLTVGANIASKFLKSHILR